MRSAVLVAAMAAMTLTGGAVAVGSIDRASAMCARDVDCHPVEPPDPPDPPTSTASGVFTSFAVWADACEPRMTPWNNIVYDAPGSSRTEIYHSDMPISFGYPVVLIATRWASHVAFKHQSHGTYLAKSYNSAGTLVDSREGSTC